MITFKLWRCLHYPPSLRFHRLYQRLLRMPPRYTTGLQFSFNRMWVWVVLGVVFSQSFLSSSYSIYTFIIPLLITILSLRFVWQVVNALNRLYATGNYELLALMPSGQLPHVLDACRLIRYPSDWTIHLTSVYVIGLLIILILTNFLQLFTPLLLLLRVITGVAHYVDYLQSFVMASLLAMLASQRQKRSEAQAAALGGFLAIQIMLYLVGVVFLGGVVERFVVSL
jgi:hypothetical protein